MKDSIYEKLIQHILENQDSFYRLAYSYTKNQEDALDAVQNAVCKALDSYEGIRNINAIRTWFYKILIHECLIIIKQRKKEMLSEEISERDAVYWEPGYGKDDSLNEEVDKLEMDVQTVIRLRFFEELSLKEIADITGLNMNTVKSKLYRGLKALKENIQEEVLWEN